MKTDNKPAKEKDKPEEKRPPPPSMKGEIQKLARYPFNLVMQMRRNGEVTEKVWRSYQRVAWWSAVRHMGKPARDQQDFEARFGRRAMIQRINKSRQAIGLPAIPLPE